MAHLVCCANFFQHHCSAWLDVQVGPLSYTAKFPFFNRVCQENLNKWTRLQTVLRQRLLLGAWEYGMVWRVPSCQPQKVVKECFYLHTSCGLTLPNSSLGYQLLPVLKGMRWFWTCGCQPGGGWWAFPAQFTAAIQTETKGNDCSCHSFRKVWAAHMQMLVSLSFPDFDGIEGRNGQSQTAKAGKMLL